MSDLDDRISALTAAVAAETDAAQSAITLMNQIPGLITDAVAKAQAAGASPDQLQALTDLSSKLQAQAPNIASAVVQNTPAQTAKTRKP